MTVLCDPTLGIFRAGSVVTLADWRGARVECGGVEDEGISQEPQGFAGEDGRRTERRGGVSQRQHQQPAPAGVQATWGVRRQRLVARVQVRRPRSHVSRPGPGAGTRPPEARRRRRRRARRAPPHRRRARGRALPQVRVRRHPRGVAVWRSQGRPRAHPLRVGGRRRREGRLADHVAHDARPAMRAQTRGRPRRRGLRRVGRHRAVAGVGTMRGSSAVRPQRHLGGRIDATDAAQAPGARPRHPRERWRRGSHHPAQGAARARRSRGRVGRRPRPVADAQKTIVPRATRRERVERSHAEHEPDEDDEVRPPAERGGGGAVPEAGRERRARHRAGDGGGGWMRRGRTGPTERSHRRRGRLRVRLFADSRRRRLRRQRPAGPEHEPRRRARRARTAR